MGQSRWIEAGIVLCSVRREVGVEDGGAARWASGWFGRPQSRDGFELTGQDMTRRQTRIATQGDYGPALTKGR